MSTSSTTSGGLRSGPRSVLRSGSVSLVGAGTRDPGATGDLTAALGRANQPAPRAARARGGRIGRAPVRSAARRSAAALGDDASRGAPVDDRRAESGRSARANAAKGAFIRYAGDNRIVRAIYAITTGRLRLAFYAVVVVAMGLALYPSVRDLYVSYRAGDIKSKQLALRQSYNDKLKSDVDKLLTKDGIEQVARNRLGLVMPGEKKINIVGGGDKKKDKGSSGPTNSSQLDRSEQKVGQNAPWYIRALDTVFSFKAEDDQPVSPTGK